MQLSRSYRPHPTLAISSGHPLIQILNPDRLVDEIVQHSRIKHGGNSVVNTLENGLRQTTGLNCKVKRVLHVLVILETQTTTHFREKLNDVSRRRLHQIFKQHRISQHQIVNMMVGVRTPEGRTSPPRKLNRVLVWLDDLAPGDNWNVI